uniref:Uncharacterized protein n=1 Tax=Hanusia phi TaxID=3032 RepID=A0A7S0DWE2_9CRYP|mmetsp:Transcript_11721/g.26860  ORF Transcript_11721/g.26860 Transcript_11721/m.26860 type:complete len:451 (+) Transcript_11721:138-1490(+)
MFFLEEFCSPFRERPGEAQVMHPKPQEDANGKGSSLLQGLFTDKSERQYEKSKDQARFVPLRAEDLVGGRGKERRYVESEEKRGLYEEFQVLHAQGPAPDADGADNHHHHMFESQEGAIERDMPEGNQQPDDDYLSILQYDIEEPEWMSVGALGHWMEAAAMQGRSQTPQEPHATTPPARSLDSSCASATSVVKDPWPQLRKSLPNSTPKSRPSSVVYDVQDLETAPTVRERAGLFELAAELASPRIEAPAPRKSRTRNVSKEQEAEASKEQTRAERSSMAPSQKESVKDIMRRMSAAIVSADIIIQKDTPRGTRKVASAVPEEDARELYKQMSPSPAQLIQRGRLMQRAGDGIRLHSSPLLDGIQESQFSDYLAFRSDTLVPPPSLVAQEVPCAPVRHAVAFIRPTIEEEEEFVFVSADEPNQPAPRLQDVSCCSWSSCPSLLPSAPHS